MLPDYTQTVPLGDNAAWRPGWEGAHTWTNIRIRNAAHLLYQPRIAALSVWYWRSPIDKYLTAQAAQLATARCPSVSWLLWSPVRPAARSQSNLTPAAYHLTCVLGLHTSSHRAAQSNKDWPPRPEADRGSDQTGNSSVSKGPWSTNAEEMTLWICSAAWNEVKWLSRCRGQCRRAGTGSVSLACKVGRHWRINWRESSPDRPRRHLFLQIRPRSCHLLLLTFWVRVAKGTN